MLMEIVKGVVGSAEWHLGKKYNVLRISGLETQSALVVLTRTNLHILTGFRLKTVGTPAGSSGYGSKASEGRAVVEWVASIDVAAAARAAALSSSSSSSNTYNNSSSSSSSSSSSGGGGGGGGSFYNTGSDRTAKPTPHLESTPSKATFAAAEAAYAAAAVGLLGTSTQQTSESEWVAGIWKELLSSEEGYRCYPLDDIHTIFKRRHQLKYTALRITDAAGSSVLFSCDTEAKCDELLLKLFESDLPASVFHQVIGMRNLQLLRGVTNMYNRLMALFLSSATSKWLKGDMSNFDYLMHVNLAAGRSYQDLTQYPVFPWVCY